MTDAANLMTCERMHARISISTCVGRQTRGVDHFGEGGRNIPPECRKCEQGERILANPENLEKAPHQINGAETAEGVEEMADSRFERKRGCSNCRRDKTIVSGGLCIVCMRAARGKTGEERVAALAEVKRKIDSGEIKTRKGKHNTASAPIAPTKPALAPRLNPERRIGWDVATDPKDTKTPQIVPVTLRLAIEISVRINTIPA